MKVKLIFNFKAMKKKYPVKTPAEAGYEKHLRKQIRLAKTQFYIHNMMITNKSLLAGNNINNLILF
ncbi:hypothetical protein HYN49_01075 [Flavobacterium pallidum]|uniref:Uncharacterized protein n=1 Tax=Flavobacterium pallidum TaxID=2172098 RepID=A0A2S1SDY8_9FLAO|nr:hypothetical protein HYN49_01075 [Flavobacterium pallidum]